MKKLTTNSICGEKTLNYSAKIDRLNITKIKVVNVVDPERLTQKGIVKTEARTNYHLKTLTGVEFDSIILRSNIIKENSPELAKLLNYFEFTKNTFPYMTVLADRDEHYNLVCMSADNLKDRLKEISKLLESVFGIIVDFSGAHISRIEINKTFPLENAYAKYDRSLRAIISSLDAKGARTGEWSKNNNPTYYHNHKGSGLELKVYDKKDELKNVRNDTLINKDYLRFEVKISNTNNGNNVENYLGTDVVDDLTDSAIEAFLHGFIQDAYSNYKKKRTERVKKISKQIEDRGSNFNRDWINLLIYRNIQPLKGTPILLTLEELEAAIKAAKFNNRASKKRFYDTAMDVFKSEGYIPEDKKLNELFYKLGVET